MRKILSILLLFCPVVVFGQTYPEKPNPPRLVNDFTGMLSVQQINTLEEKLVAFDNKTSNQVTVVIVSTVHGNDPTDYAVELGRKWGIGNKENNGVLLLVAKNDRKVTIVPGYGLEGSLPDATCQSIIDNDIVPSFKAGDYYKGISNGVESIMQATQGAYTAPEGYSKRGKGKKSPWTILIYILVFIVFILFSGRRGGRGGGMASRRGIWWFPTGGSFSSGSSGGSRGFGGFGGGSFGGGGASGSW